MRSIREALLCMAAMEAAIIAYLYLGPPFMHWVRIQDALWRMIP